MVRLKSLRGMLVEKNMAGIYTDDVFKEQSGIIENKMTQAQIAKEDATINKYNIDDVTSL